METQERAQPEGLWKPRKGPNQMDYGNPGKGPTRGTMETQERAQQEGLWKSRKGPNQRDYGNPGKGPTRGTMETQERAQPEGLWKPRKGPNQRDYGNPGKCPTRGTMEIQERAQPRSLVSGSRFEPGILTSKRDQVKLCPRRSIKFKISIQPKQMSVHSTDSKLGVNRLYSQFDGLDCSETITYLISLYFCWSPSTVFTLAKGVSARFLHELYNIPPLFYIFYLLFSGMYVPLLS
jgi:hypothetical protein